MKTNEHKPGYTGIILDLIEVYEGVEARETAERQFTEYLRQFEMPRATYTEDSTVPHFTEDV